MTRDPVTIPVAATIGQAAEVMMKRRVRRLPVVAAGDRALVGIVSKGDVLAAAPATLNPFSPAAAGDAGLDGPVRAIMTADPVTVAPDAPLEAAAQIMLERKIGGLPVLLGTRLVGLLTESDLFRAFAAALGGGRASLRITFELGPDEDVIPMVVGLAARHGQRVVSVAAYALGDLSLAVVRLAGPESEALVDQLWKSGHRVRSILRLGGARKPDGT